MPSPIPVTRLLPRDFGLKLGVCSSPLTKHSGDTTLRVPVSAFHGNLAYRLWSSVIHWRELCDLESIGSGGFGLVFKATYFGETVAVKHVKCAKNKLASRQSFWAELNAAHLRHENLVQVIAASTQANGDDLLGARGDSVIGTIIMEYAGDVNLQQVIYNAAEPLHTGSCVRYAADVARALRHLHAHGVVHLDVKPANVIVSRAGVCKLADFGCSLKVELVRDRDGSARRMEIGGTYTHRAPELLRGEDVTPGADVYSFGVTLWQLLTREPPYEGERQHILYAVVAFNLRPDLNKDVFGPSGPGRSLKELLSRCWSAEPSQRPSADQLLTELSIEFPP
ncbi:proto-oncogene serine/threonine-protein kinase mos [Hemibagrus wyckioides]|uniref:proto-oncogene serine/threonine-protein kinase mos n=1 Tax=Hemibagrus wyckioides TaxID=337641 RepID=UPI00266CE48F|nr:proto-oncogene serine/threonine-protein kinase mos [Hemibagrus wyckioides]